jgi:FkbM family methyltransferase
VRFGVRRRLGRRISVEIDGKALLYECDSFVDAWRVRTMLEKERGTIEWIRTEVRKGDVFYDVGANMGIYVPLAASVVGERGRVYAFEPHVGNAHTLLKNVRLNKLAHLVTVVTSALNDRGGFLPFNYYSDVSGSSMSQLNDSRDDNDREFTPVFTELKYATTIDLLIATEVIKAPQHIKIDVDGNELLILRGMRELLNGPDRPRSIQVEVNLRYRDALFAFMEDVGFSLAYRHYTSAGDARIQAGITEGEVSYNAVFRSGAATEKDATKRETSL